MKRKFLLFISIAFCACFNGHAQISKGSIFLGGQLGFNSQSNSNTLTNGDNSKNTAFYFSPAAGKAIKDNMIVGIDLDYEFYETTPATNSEKLYSNVFGAGIFIRRYLPLGKGFYVFAQGRFGFSYANGHADTSSNFSNGYFNLQAYTLGVGIYPGVSYQVSKRLQLETGFNNLAYINFQHSKSPDYDLNGNTVPIKTNSFNIGASLNNLASFTLGFRVLLASK